MPKTVYLVRHAKSSWSDPGLSDRKRPLNKRGQRDAPRMAKRLKARRPQPERIISSPALRARTTAEVFAEALHLKQSKLVIDDAIYGASPGVLIGIMQNQDNRHDCIMLVGHNPDMTWLLNQLTDADIDNMPTCAVACVKFDTDSWKDVGNSYAELVEFDYPKKIQD